MQIKPIKFFRRRFSLRRELIGCILRLAWCRSPIHVPCAFIWLFSLSLVRVVLCCSGQRLQSQPWRYYWRPREIVIWSPRSICLIASSSSSPPYFLLKMELHLYIVGCPELYLWPSICWKRHGLGWRALRIARSRTDFVSTASLNRTLICSTRSMSELFP